MILDGEVLETLLVADGLSKVLKDWVNSLRGRAIETINVDILSRFFLLGLPSIDYVCGVLIERNYLVQLDSAHHEVSEVLRADFSLVRQERERDVVDAESEFVCQNIIENHDLPIGLAVHQFDRKDSLLRKFLPIKIVWITKNETVQKKIEQQEQVGEVNS